MNFYFLVLMYLNLNSCSLKISYFLNNLFKIKRCFIILDRYIYLVNYILRLGTFFIYTNQITITILIKVILIIK